MKKIKISYILNIIIVIMTIIGFITMITNFKFMHGQETTIASSPNGRFRFFTIDSNLLIGIVTFIFLLQERKLLKGEITKIKRIFYILKYVGTCAVGLTLGVVVLYLEWLTPYGPLSMYMNTNLFFHGLIPLLSVITFIFFEKSNNLKIKDTIFGMIPTMIYAIYYITNILIHIENKMVSLDYDWYYFVQAGINTFIKMIVIIIGFSYIICLGLWFLNKEKNVKNHFDNRV